MELFLNLAWLVLSTALVLGYLAFAHSVLRRRRWTLVVALVLLIVVLLPAISMTDDLAAINNPAETDHIFRRYEPSLHLYTDTAAVAIVALLIGTLAISIGRTRGETSRTRFLTDVLLEGSVRAFGVRPPPLLSAVAG